MLFRTMPGLEHWHHLLLFEFYHDDDVHGDAGDRRHLVPCDAEGTALAGRK